MELENRQLSQLQENEQNPRYITEDRFSKLINSVLVLPQMLKIRPVVIDGEGVILGGNMRYRALKEIASWPFDKLTDTLLECRDYQKKPAAQQKKLLDFWKKWLQDPSVPVVEASELTKEEKCSSLGAYRI